MYAKGQVGTLYDRTKAYEISMYATFGTTGRERVTVDADYENNGLSGEDELKGSRYYPTIGIQGTVYEATSKAVQNPNKGKKGRG